VQLAISPALAWAKWLAGARAAGARAAGARAAGARAAGARAAGTRIRDGGADDVGDWRVARQWRAM
jgi:hypothetical protein